MKDADSELPNGEVNQIVGYVIPDVSTSDSYLNYLNEMGKVPLLTKAQEQELGRRMVEGSGQDRSDARDQMILSHLRLVVSTVKKFNASGIDMMDLIQAGNEGLLFAANHFIPSKTVRFSSYAKSCIWGYIMIGLNMNRHIPIHNEARAMLNKVLKRMEVMMQNEGREVWLEEAAIDLGFDPLWIRDICNSNVVMSLDSRPTSEETDGSIIDFIPDTHVNEVETNANMVQEALNFIHGRDRTILEMYYGLSGSDRKSLTKIGEEMGLTHQTVSALKSRALAKIRKRFEHYWDS